MTAASASRLRRPRAVRPPVAAHLRAARAAVHLTQAELAEQLGVKPRAISRWERGETRPTRKNVKRLVERLAEIDAGVAMKLRTALTGEPQPASAPPPSADALMDAVREAADQLDVPARRVRAAFAFFLERLEAERFTLDTARATFARVDAESGREGR